MKRSKPVGSPGNRRAPMRISLCGGARQFRLPSTPRCALFPLPEGEGQREGKCREAPPRHQTNPGIIELHELLGGFPQPQ